MFLVDNGFVNRISGNWIRNIFLNFEEWKKSRIVKWNWTDGNWPVLSEMYVVRHAQLDCGWSDVIIFSCCQFLPSSCTASLQFKCTYTFLFRLPILWSAITSNVNVLGRPFNVPFLIHFENSREKIVVQSTNVHSDPRPLQFSRMVCSPPWMDIT